MDKDFSDFEKIFTGERGGVFSVSFCSDHKIIASKPQKSPFSILRTCG
jgi:hypothetical protein